MAVYFKIRVAQQVDWEGAHSILKHFRIYVNNCHVEYIGKEMKLFLILTTKKSFQAYTVSWSVS